MRARLVSPDRLPELRDALTSDPRVNVKITSEQEFYAESTRTLRLFASTVGVAVGVLMALGAVFTAMNTMYSAVATRAREIATLRALGFGGGAVLTSVLVESMLLGAVGGALGGALAFLIFNGLNVATLNFDTFTQIAFSFAVTPTLLGIGIAFSLVMGLIGGALPGIRAARMPIAAALREL
jgi:putative ABC transport system permease protein